jgi:hypothetical protein
MKGIWLAVVSIGLSLGAPRPAEAVTLPNGNSLWNFAAGPYVIAVEVIHGSALGTMTVVNTTNGRSAVGTLYPAAVVDRPHGSLDEYIADGFFQEDVFFPLLGLGDIPPGSNPNQALIHIGLGDLDGVAFDGATPGFSGQFLVPANPPPLDVFELNSLVVTHYEFNPAVSDYSVITQTYGIYGLPEPALGALALPLLALLAARRRATGA